MNNQPQTNFTPSNKLESLDFGIDPGGSFSEKLTRGVKVVGEAVGDILFSSLKRRSEAARFVLAATAIGDHTPLILAAVTVPITSNSGQI